MANKFKIYEWLKKQKQTLFLWASLITALGMACYFSISKEPSITILVIMFICACISGIVFRKFPFIVLISVFVGGFGYAGIYTHTKNVIPLAHDKHNITISGEIISTSDKNEKTQYVIISPEFSKIRVSGATTNGASIGTTISGTGGLFTPKPADIPYGFDFARWAYFNGISATGYINDINITNTPVSGVYNMREYIHNTTKSFLSDTLVLGYKNALSVDHRNTWATNGMAHIWSISGYHITLIAGWLFLIFYLLFRTIPPIVRRIPARIPALVCTWCGLAGYVILSGAGVATLRAFIMATLAIIAFIVGRNIISLRMICCALLALVIINPYYVMQSGFQLSFAAIFGLVWLWKNLNPPTPKIKIIKYVYTAILTALTATIFTAPFISAHFGSIPVYGIIGNLIFLPLFSFILMPLVIFGTFSSLIGFGEPLVWSHKIYNHLFDVAKHISNLPHAEIITGYISNTIIVLFIFGFACIIFIKNLDTFKSAIARNLNFVIGGICIIAGITLWAFRPKPVFYISNDHKLIASITDDAKLKFNKYRDSGNYFAFDTWKTNNREEKGTKHQRLKSESGIYYISYPKWKLAYIQNFVPLSENINDICDNADIKYIASYFNINSEKCNNKIIRGGAVIYKSGAIQTIPSNRLWHNRHE